ncbi:MAG: hypothetical protein AB7I27_04305 [Bacteriovoracaceae bacterium]
MEKNWLIRTKSNHILGPVTKDKVLELYRNGSIRPDDEVCSGNGYWFFIREDDLVEKYLLGNQPQGFNPISEAKDVLTTEEKAIDDVTVVKGISLGQLNDSVAENIELTSESEPQDEQLTLNEADLSIASEDSKISQKTKPLKKSKNKKKQINKESYLRPIGIICFILLILLIYFRKSIIRIIFTSMAIAVESSYAQEDQSPKKKSFLKNQ